MIDIGQDQLNRSYQELKFLVLETSDAGYCTASKDWTSVLLKVHTNIEKLNYEKMFFELGASLFFERLEAIIISKKINVLYFDAPIMKILNLHSLERLRKHCFIVVVLDDNALFFNDWFRYTVQSVDLVISHDYVEKFRYQLYGVDAIFLPQVSDLSTFFNSEVSLGDKNILLSSIGRVDRVGRREFVQRITESEIPLELFGPGTPGGFVTNHQKIDIFQRSIMSLNFSGCAEFFHGKHVASVDKNIKQVKGRLWELALSKCMILTEDAPCIEKSFVPGKELVIFDTQYDLVEKLRYYRDHPTDVEEIAINGYDRAKADLDPQKSMDKVLSYICYKFKNRIYVPRVLKVDRLYTNLALKDKATFLAKEQKTLSTIRLARRHFFYQNVNIFLSVYLIWNFLKEVLRIRLKRHKSLVSLVQKYRKLTTSNDLEKF